ncbi:hypothetical protein ACLOJK_026571 [Asimina triloba]
MSTPIGRGEAVPELPTLEAVASRGEGKEMGSRGREPQERAGACEREACPWRETRERGGCVPDKAPRAVRG